MPGAVKAKIGGDAGPALFVGAEALKGQGAIQWCWGGGVARPFSSAMAGRVCVSGSRGRKEREGRSVWR